MALKVMRMLRLVRRDYQLHTNMVAKAVREGSYIPMMVLALVSV